MILFVAIFTNYNSHEIFFFFFCSTGSFIKKKKKDGKDHKWYFTTQRNEVQIVLNPKKKRVNSVLTR